jgi:hypothetical protein
LSSGTIPFGPEGASSIYSARAPSAPASASHRAQSSQPRLRAT